MRTFRVLVHGESWEVAATRSISERIQKIIEDHVNSRDGGQSDGTFALHYTPGKADRGNSITIPLSSGFTPTRDSQSNPYLPQGSQNDPNFEKAMRL